ncbi:uncharacterized protein BDZ99DRAFT_513507 [Mytilinidion resinicola]|uniref:Uncharacterized protein n=1 Tax=Mytilinidion resinicola TaxID=574789 RepID=A0A6A6ZAD8_9PEZI|nr:uncharacterized protein BDZ99DRAFT_513507 [Mytilinidion resinicola]KAF2817264.1 hypothetical protein BDZ99DRAFT_513507 [Mytilinidion resinicola]
MYTLVKQRSFLGTKYEFAALPSIPSSSFQPTSEPNVTSPLLRTGTMQQSDQAELQPPNSSGLASCNTDNIPESWAWSLSLISDLVWPVLQAHEPHPPILWSPVTIPEAQHFEQRHPPPKDSSYSQSSGTNVSSAVPYQHFWGPAPLDSGTSDILNEPFPSLGGYHEFCHSDQRPNHADYPSNSYYNHSFQPVGPHEPDTFLRPSQSTDIPFEVGTVIYPNVGANHTASFEANNSSTVQNRALDALFDWNIGENSGQLYQGDQYSSSQYQYISSIVTGSSDIQGSRLSDGQGNISSPPLENADMYLDSTVPTAAEAN